MNSIQKTTHLLLIVLITLFLSAGKVTAVEISITDNGSGSTNETSVSQSSEIKIEQNNNASVENSVSSSSNSGNNEANSNTGGLTNIESGNSENNITVVNSVNRSTTTQDCCPTPLSSPSSVNITGNGADSHNTANTSLSQVTTVTINNNAIITTNTNGVANSGGNKANNNNGDVNIKTGKVEVTETIINTGVNTTHLKFANTTTQDSIVKIAGNGTDSVNTVNRSQRNIVDITINQTADIINNSNWYANSGNNSANSNLGDVSIITGDVAISTIIQNIVNTSNVEITCCDNKPQTPPPCTYNCGGENPNPNNPGSPSNGGNGGGGNGGGGGSNSSNGSGGSVLGTTSVGDILPATGSLWNLWLTILAGLLFALGFYLRMHPGRAPNAHLAL